MLSTPLLREGIPIGAIHIRRTEVRPFTEKQITLLETFASQAVIAIENVRLFKEIQERNANCARRWSIRRRPPKCLASSAARPRTCSRCSTRSSRVRRGFVGLMTWCCGFAKGTSMVARAHFGPIPVVRVMKSASMSHGIAGCASMAHSTFPTSATQNDFPTLGSVSDCWRTFLAAPLRQQGELIGTLNARRTEVRPFTPAQIKLLETFADQAVIAIENVRLLQELQERTDELVRSVGELKALGEVGQAVSSTLELETVLTRIVSHAVQLSGTDGGAIYEYDEQSAKSSCCAPPIIWKKN